jgi:hypothetical protein
MFYHNSTKETVKQANKAWLIFDEKDHTLLPRNLRISQEPAKENKLGISGSAQFSEQTLQAALKKMSGKIWIVDLREESHGFVNGIPVSWFEGANQGNQGKSIGKIQHTESVLLSNLRRQRKIFVNKVLDKKDSQIQSTESKVVIVEKVETEAELAKRLQVEYIRIPVLDHHRPSDKEVDRFITFMKSLPPDAWVHFHCLGGKGRTTTFLLMADMLQHAPQIPLEQMIERQKQLLGSAIFDPPSETDPAWKKQARIERTAFVARFYQYAADPNGYKQKTWSEWVKSVH